jgi:hypothetical protein
MALDRLSLSAWRWVELSGFAAKPDACHEAIATVHVSIQKVQN